MAFHQIIADDKMETYSTGLESTAFVCFFVVVVFNQSDYQVITEPISYRYQFQFIGFVFVILHQTHNRSDPPPPTHHTGSSTLEVTPTNVMRGQGHLLPLGHLIGSFYLHANHSGGNRERAGLIMPNV